jgi:hypothetical protein
MTKSDFSIDEENILLFRTWVNRWRTHKGVHPSRLGTCNDDDV